MISVRTGIRADEVRIQGQHVLFVEGNDLNAVDPEVLNELFSRGLRIEPLGPSFSVKSVAEALHKHHPTYYFLIDRDHHDKEFVEKCWKNFPNPDTHNLLIWRRREIENYFIDPNYMIRSKYCTVNQDELSDKILHFSRQRLFLDVANHVIISIREELKRNWISKFSNPADFTTKKEALLKLNQAREFNQHRTNVERGVSPEEVERRFADSLQRMTGGQEKIAFGVGDWLHLIQGKKVLLQVVNSECFCVRTTDGRPLKSREKLNEIVRELLQNDAKHQPRDFMNLKNLIDKRVNESR